MKKEILQGLFVALMLILFGVLDWHAAKKDWCDDAARKMKTETLAPSVRHEFNERCK